MRFATLDLGSNTFLCLIAEVTNQGQIVLLEDAVEVVRLGQGVAQNGFFAEEALLRASSCLKRFADLIQKHKPDVVLGAATAAARSVSNGIELVKIAQALGIPLEIISGDREAELTFAGAISGSQDRNPKPDIVESSSRLSLVIDIGGGSTEIILGNNKQILYKKSFNVGVVKLRERHIKQFPVPPETQSELNNEIKTVFNELQSLHFDKPSIDVIAVAGTPTTLAAAAIGKFDPNKIDGFTFTLFQLKEWMNRLSPLIPSEIERQWCVPSGRSDVLFVGVMILIGVLEALELPTLKVSTRGLRYGLLFELWKAQTQKSLNQN